MPPRTPPQRLNTLRRFAGEWIDAQIRDEINRPNRAENMKNSGIRILFDRMTAAYEKDCSFFDPTVQHGGPNPNNQARTHYIP